MYSYEIERSPSYLAHHGIKGQKWGVRRYQNEDGSYTAAGKKRRNYASTGIGAAIARRQNEKVDASFKAWNENAKKKADAIELGKKANLAKRAYEVDRSDKEAKKSYKEAEREYKSALRGNTTYRKGQIKQEVGSDLSRKYLSEAKKIEKQLKADPNNKDLQKQYNEYMSKHDVERAKARRAPEVAANRSRKIASIKRGMTVTAKAAVATAAVAAGTYAVNKYLSSHDVTINGASVRVGSGTVNGIKNGLNVISEIRKYF